MASSVELVAIPKDRVKEVWALAEGFLQSAADVSGMDLSEQREDAVQGRVTLWLAWSDRCEAAALTRKDWDACTLLLCGGENMGRWVHLIEGLEDQARREGCAHMKIYGRPGWGRVLEGYKPMLEKAL